MIYRALLALFSVATFAALGAALYMHFCSPSQQPGRALAASDHAGLVVEQPEQILPDPVVGRDYEVPFRVINSTDKPHRVVGGGWL